jgi:hypothetical protein
MFSFGQIVPATLLLWLVLGSIGSLASRPFLVIFGVSLTIYVAIVLCFSIYLGRRHDFRYAFLCPLIYLTIHLGLGAGFLAEALNIGTKRNSFKNGMIS